MFSVFSTIVTFFLEILLPFYFFVCCMLQMGTNVGAVQPLRSNNTVFFPRDINNNLFGNFPCPIFRDRHFLHVTQI